LDKGDVATAKSLIQADPALVNSIDMRGRTPLHSAARLGDIEIVTLLIKDGADVSAKDSDGVTPLHDAVEAGHAEIVELLLVKGADTDRCGVGVRQD
jgi:ankyrin repeat protein